MLGVADIADEAADGLRSRSIPLYGASDTAEPEVVGSASLIDIASATFLGTAGHVMHDLASTEVYLPTRNGLARLEERGVMGGAAATEAEDYLRDIAVVPLPHGIVDALSSDFIRTQVHELDVALHQSPGTSYAFVGCPASKNRPKRGKVVPVRQPYVVVSADESVYRKVGVVPETHIVGKFVLKRAYRNMQRHIAPAPAGMSGGGVWALGSATELLKRTNQPKLAGIGIQFKRQMQVLVGIRIEVAIAALRECYPETRAHLPEISSKLKFVTR